jgi:hypothetical protein
MQANPVALAAAMQADTLSKIELEKAGDEAIATTAARIIGLFVILSCPLGLPGRFSRRGV